MTDRVATPLYLLDGAGFYEDCYVRTDEGWKIAAVCLRRLSASSERTLGEALYVGLAAGERP